MNIKDFLIDNYIWIIVIILITIITIIGFLADKKKSEKKVKTQTPNNQNTSIEQSIAGIGNLSYQAPGTPAQNQTNNNIPMDNNLSNATIEPMVQMNNLEQNQGIENIVQQQMAQTNGTIPMGVNIQNNTQPMENVVTNTISEPIYQPLSEQKPVIAPQPIQNFSNNQIQTENIPNQNQMENISNQTQVMNFANMQPTQIVQEQPLNQMPSYNNFQMPISQENNNFMGQQNFVQQNATIPQPINMQPTPQPVNVQPIMQNNMMEQQMMQQNYNNQTMQNNGTMPQMTTPQPINSPINFVYGPQGNNQNI